MLKIGCHLSASQGYTHMGEEILSLGGNTFQFFTRNPRGGSVKALDEADCAAYRALAAENGIGEVIAHAPYTINACSDKDTVRDFARRAMAEDLDRLEEIPGALYNFHPGSHVGQGLEVGIAQIAEILNAVLTENTHTTVLLETMAGKGSEVGGRFEELREILDRVEEKGRMGVCMDTCHISDAGYDIIGDLDGVLTEFDRVVGLSRLRALHLNDSKNPQGAHKDRHEKIGEGFLGGETFARIVNHSALAGLPMVLETPNDLAGYAQEIALLKSLYKE